MGVNSWLEMAKADADKRGLAAVVPLLDGLAASLQSLREAADGMSGDELEPVAARSEDGADAGLHTAESASGTSSTAAPAESSLASGSIADLVAQLSRGPLTSERLVEECLARIIERQPELNAFITITADEALAAARAADREFAAGRQIGPLHGIPLSLKDLVDQAGVPTTAGSLVRKSHRASADAPVTARLREAGAVFVGKTNLHEFAFGTTSEDSGFGAAKNPFDPTRSPGGSSGGSAISVAAGMAIATVGTDTGGSIRIPSAACGIVGLKPEWGEISAAGVVPLSRQLDHVGPMTRSVADAWLMYDVMRGARGRATPSAGAVSDLRVGIPRGFLFDRLDEEVEQVVLRAIESLRSAGAQVSDAPIAHVADTPHAYLPLVLSDGAEYHARTLETQPDDYTPNVRFRLEMGRYVMAEDYVRALRLRARLTRSVDAALAEVDVLALPALAIPAPPIGAATVSVKGGTDAVRSLMLRCTQLFNLSGHPAMSIPCGTTHAGLPVGLQLVGRKGGTTRLLRQALGVEARLATLA
jgi:aspartyl-tRNA(Asn)/glutamyl-tRNA(Gln) amidotransferase subunit A